MQYMVLISDVNSEIGVQVGSNLCYLVCVRNLITSRADTNRFFSSKRPISPTACATCSELPSNIGIMLGALKKGSKKENFFLFENILEKEIPMVLMLNGN